MKSVRTTMLLILGILVISICGLFFGVSYSQSYSTLEDEIYSELMNLAFIGSELMDGATSNRVVYLETLTDYEYIKSEENTKEEKIEFLEPFVTPSSGFDFFGYADAAGDAVTTLGEVTNVTQTDFFQRPFTTGKSGTSNVWVTEDRAFIVYNVPVKNNNGQVIGVIYSARNAKPISDLVSDITIRETGYIFGIDIASGDKVFDGSDYNYILQGGNIEEIAKTDTSFSAFAAVIAKARAGENGVTKVTY